MKLPIKCKECGRVYNLHISDEDYGEYIKGNGLVQDIFWYLPCDERELLITKICGTCWDKMFSEVS